MSTLTGLVGAKVFRPRQEIVILEVIERAQDELRQGNVQTADRLLSQAITTLDMYAQERVLVQRIERNGLSAPSTIRSLDDWRRQRRLAVNSKPCA